MSRSLLDLVRFCEAARERSSGYRVSETKSVDYDRDGLPRAITCTSHVQLLSRVAGAGGVSGGRAGIGGGVGCGNMLLDGMGGRDVECEKRGKRGGKRDSKGVGGKGVGGKGVGLIGCGGGSGGRGRGGRGVGVRSIGVRSVKERGLAVGFPRRCVVKRERVKRERDERESDGCEFDEFGGDEFGGACDAVEDID